ncbi:hypothetical protein BGP77_00690 [Saccharospirillum sp. MSK14-1]|uniref:hypothetical protein n=1 Tax=Saccharospirillum sp. MSK14-1 TaxID=1897632 RepID=UPI000D3D7ADB|nr:hypothetical protein [Saccharospirillum sp. MSK14-1]PTY37246.1 hypothetical protein BGP77_00690 [Saccharospirillum sp. MSK14-1]
MEFAISPDDQTFRQRMERCDIPVADFNHRAHLRLAYIYLCESDPDTATDQMRETLNQFLIHHQVDPAKFHETLTKAWILAVRHFMNKAGSATSADDLIDRYPQMLDTQIMLTHYTKERLFSEPARKAFIAPDIERIP